MTNTDNFNTSQNREDNKTSPSVKGEIKSKYLINTFFDFIFHLKRIFYTKPDKFKT